MLLAGVACNNEDVPNEPQGKYPILFRCSDDTRAVATANSMKEDVNGFDVYAYIEASSTGATYSFYKNVKWNNDKSMWLYEGLEYWVPGATYWFKAIYPKGIATVDNDDTTQAVTIDNFDITTQQDILVAETTREGMLVDKSTGAPSTGSVVQLQFQHLLSCVVVKLKSEIDNVTVSDISLEDIAQTGNYSNGNWTSEQTVTINKLYSGEALVKDATDFVDVTDGGFLVIPESIDGEQRLIIRTSHKKYEVVIPVITWEKGKKYTYTLTIKQENIEFNEPGVDIWDEENATGSVVIK